MTTAEYVTALSEDISRLGLGYSNHTVPSWGNLWSTLAHTSNIGSPSHLRAARKGPEVYTELGNIMLEHGLAEDPIKFSIGNMRCCSSAEERLIGSIRPESIGNPELRAPVVITNQGQAQAIMKGWGERSIYGLRDNPEYGIVAGAFSEPDTKLQQRMVRADVPFYVDLEEAGLSLPLRMGGFMIPQQIRKSMLAACRIKPPTQSHETITTFADELAEIAEPLPEVSGLSQEDWQHYNTSRFSEYK